MQSPLRLERRLTQPKWLNWGVPLLSLLGALILGGIVLFATGKNPISVYARIVERGFASTDAFSRTLISATPFAFTGLAASVAFRMGLINIGGEGQLYLGTIGAAFAGIAFQDQPTAVIITTMIIFGMLFGGAWAAIVGILKAKFSTNEIITSLMLNYVAAIFLDYLIFNSNSYWRDPKSYGFPTGKRLIKNAYWNDISIGSIEIPFGFVVAVVAAVIVWFLYNRTRFGYEVGVIASSPNAARYAGIRARWKIITVMALSGALAGLGGASDVGDFRHVLDAKGVQISGYGYTGIVVAALARLNPLSAIFVAVFLGGLSNAGYALQGPDFPSGLVGTLQGLILFTAVAGEILTRYRIKRQNTIADGVIV